MSRMSGTRYVYCPDCQSMTQPSTGTHICSKYKEGQQVSSIKKTWNFSLNCWEVAKDESNENKIASRIQQEGMSPRERSEPMQDVYRPAYKEVTPGTFIRSPESGAEKQKAEVDLEKREMSWQEYLNTRYPEKAKEKKEKEEEYEYSSCELPSKGDPTAKHTRMCLCFECRPKHIKYHLDACKCWECYTWKRGKGHDVKFEPNNYQRNYTSPYAGSSGNWKDWKPVKPFEGVDRVKWPNTYMFLLGLYYINSQWYNGKHISDEEYRDRILHQKYKPEPKYNNYSDYYNRHMD